ncbi:hypothetical protein Lal_00033726 [Lupinus albus]|nr:hypothetical protein Lal_00033726 [Lupinus albus]
MRSFSSAPTPTFDCYIGLGHERYENLTPRPLLFFVLCTAKVVETRHGRFFPPEPASNMVTRKTILVDDQMRDLERLCFRSTCFCVTFPFLDSLCLLLGAYDIEVGLLMKVEYSCH